MDLESFIKLSECENAKFSAFIKAARKKHISSPKSAAAEVANMHKATTLELLETHKLSELIMMLREEAYKVY